MPELPEVETTRRGLAPHIAGQRVQAVVVRQPRLRWPVPAALCERLQGQTINGLTRRGKYLLFAIAGGHVLIHLGMSGRLRLVPAELAPGAHDHVDLRFENGRAMRLTDPRRFGAVLWLQGRPEQHPLLARLGPEPLGDDFDGGWLYARARGRRAPVKAFLMDAATVVGVGNIYACEALWAARIHPARAAGRISQARYGRLATAVKQVLQRAIDAGGTTLRDYVGADGGRGWFQCQLAVYGREGEPCGNGCGPIRRRVIAQRGSFYCPGCQL